MDFVYEKGPEDRARFFIGGGENRTLVLSKLHIGRYMLSFFENLAESAGRSHTRIQLASQNLESPSREAERGGSYQG